MSSCMLINVHWCTDGWCKWGPQGGGGGTPDFKWQGWSSGVKNQNPEKSLDKILALKKSHAEFPSNKNFQKALNVVTRNIETSVLSTPKNPY